MSKPEPSAMTAATPRPVVAPVRRARSMAQRREEASGGSTKSEARRRPRCSSTQGAGQRSRPIQSTVVAGAIEVAAAAARCRKRQIGGCAGDGCAGGRSEANHSWTVPRARRMGWPPGARQPVLSAGVSEERLSSLSRWRISACVVGAAGAVSESCRFFSKEGGEDGSKGGTLLG